MDFIRAALTMTAMSFSFDVTVDTLLIIAALSLLLWLFIRPDAVHSVLPTRLAASLPALQKHVQSFRDFLVILAWLAFLFGFSVLMESTTIRSQLLVFAYTICPTAIWYWLSSCTSPLQIILAKAIVFACIYNVLSCFGIPSWYLLLAVLFCSHCYFVAKRHTAETPRHGLLGFIEGIHSQLCESAIDGLRSVASGMFLHLGPFCAAIDAHGPFSAYKRLTNIPDGWTIIIVLVVVFIIGAVIEYFYEALIVCSCLVLVFLVFFTCVTFLGAARATAECRDVKLESAARDQQWERLVGEHKQREAQLEEDLDYWKKRRFQPRNNTSAEIARLEEEVTSLQKELQKSSPSHPVDSADAGRISSLNDQVAKLAEELSTLKGKESNMGRSICNLQEEVRTKIAKISSLTTDKDDLRRRNGGLESDVENLKLDVKGLESRLRALSLDVERRKRDAAAVDESRTKERSMFREEEARLNFVLEQTRVTSQTPIATESQSEYGHLSNEITHLRKAIDASKRKVSDLRGQLRKKAAQVLKRSKKATQVLKQDVQKQDKTIAHLEDNLLHLAQHQHTTTGITSNDFFIIDVCHSLLAPFEHPMWGLCGYALETVSSIGNGYLSVTKHTRVSEIEAFGTIKSHMGTFWVQCENSKGQHGLVDVRKIRLEDTQGDPFSGGDSDGADDSDDGDEQPDQYARSEAGSDADNDSSSGDDEDADEEKDDDREFRPSEHPEQTLKVHSTIQFAHILNGLEDQKKKRKIFDHLEEADYLICPTILKALLRDVPDLEWLNKKLVYDSLFAKLPKTSGLDIGLTPAQKAMRAMWAPARVLPDQAGSMGEDEMDGFYDLFHGMTRETRHQLTEHLFTEHKGQIRDLLPTFLHHLRWSRHNIRGSSVYKMLFRELSPEEQRLVEESPDSVLAWTPPPPPPPPPSLKRKAEDEAEDVETQPKKRLPSEEQQVVEESPDSEQASAPTPPPPPPSQKR